jgi:DNA-binding response OmpR family regulator
MFSLYYIIVLQSNYFFQVTLAFRIYTDILATIKFMSRKCLKWQYYWGPTEFFLMKEGFDVRCALDGHAVLEAVKKEPAFADIPFIFVTARVDRADQRRGMCEGAAP